MAQRGHELTVRPFPTTHWSLVGRAGATTGEVKRRALGDLLGRYIPALRFHLLADRRLDPDRCEDLLQGFLAGKVLEQDLIGHADRGRGRFRNFLLVSLQRYVASEARHDMAEKRVADRAAPLDEAHLAADGRPGPGAAYDVAWARAVLAEAVARLRAACLATDRQDVWAVFEARVLAPARGDAEPLGYEALVGRFGLTSPLQASNLLVTAKRSFARTLREVVGEYARDEAEVDDEIRDLRAALAAAPAAAWPASSSAAGESPGPSCPRRAEST